MEKRINRVVTDSLDLPDIISFDDIVKLLRLNPKLIYWLSSTSKNKYKTYEIPKKSGGVRIINAPVYSLKQVQRWVLLNILYKIKPTQFSYGFNRLDKNGSPLYSCANIHKYNLYVLKLDLEKFYPSISRKKVYDLFLSIGYNSQTSSILTNICTHEDALPQGAVTSPHLANLICRKMDYRLAGYCEKHNISFTRYADDMAFSSDNRNDLKKAYNVIINIITDEGFKVNKKKTHFMSPKCRKEILGITINDSQIKAPKEMKRKVRAMIHKSIALGRYDCNDSIRGYISYVNSIEPGYRDKIKKYIMSLTESTLCIQSELIKKYNSNKLFSGLPDMVIKGAKDFNIKPHEQDDFYEDEYIQHEELLEKHK